MPDPITHYDSVGGAAKGATGGTYDDVGTVTIAPSPGDDNWRMYGLTVLAAPTIPTSGQNGILIVRVSIKGTEVQNVDLPIIAITDGIATNDKEAPVDSLLIPFTVPSTVNLDNKNVTFQASSNVDVTGGWELETGILYGSEALADDPTWLWEVISRNHGWIVDAEKTEADAGISATAETAFSTSMTVDSKNKMIRGFMAFVNPNGPTAGENCIGHASFEAPGVTLSGGFSPQKMPLNVGWTASLGTPVGTPVAIVPKWWPARIPLPDADVTVNVRIGMKVALTNAGDGYASVCMSS